MLLFFLLIMQVTVYYLYNVMIYRTFSFALYKYFIKKYKEIILYVRHVSATFQTLFISIAFIVFA